MIGLLLSGGHHDLQRRLVHLPLRYNQMLRTPIVAFALLLISGWNVHGQNAAKNWYFGQGARINFNTAAATAVTTINTNEGCSAISDSSGNPLFYTDGITVWDKNNNPMPGGTLLNGNSSSTHSALIVPCSCDKYFIFTTDAFENQYQNGLQYSVVDMTQNSLLGTVVSKNNVLLKPASEKVAGVSDGSGGFWVVGHKMVTNEFVSYHIVANSDCTLDPKAAKLSKAGSNYSGGTSDYGAGQMKISPDGTLLVHAGLSTGNTSFIELFKFSTSTGTVSDINPGSTARDTNPGFYGVEFSPDSPSTYLYATTIEGANILYSYKITPPLTGRSTINNYGSVQYTLGALQLAPDGKIYIARTNNAYVDVLPSPTSTTGGGGWTGAHFNLLGGAKSLLGLPTMVTGDFSCAAPCATISEPTVSCDRGVLTYTFTLTNNSATQTIENLLLFPPLGSTYSIVPTSLHLTTPLLPGGQTIVTGTVTNASSGDRVCINVALADKDFVVCCTVQICLPSCPCLRLLDRSLTCLNGVNTYTGAVQNLAGGQLQQILVVPISPPNLIITPSQFPVVGNGATLTFALTGVAAPANVSFQVVPLGAAPLCCPSERIHIDLRDCGAPTKAGKDEKGKK